MIGKLAVLDISESGAQVAEKILALLEAKQQQEMIQYITTNAQKITNSKKCSSCGTSAFSGSPYLSDSQLTEICVGKLDFCLESRTVRVCEVKIDLTAKEFDIFALLIMNSNRVFTYEMIMDIVWHEEYDYYSRKAINNHISNLRKKLKVDPDLPEYIKSIHSVGYKFNTEDSSI